MEVDGSDSADAGEQKSLGRKKIKIQRIEDDRNRQVSTTERVATLFQRIAPLSARQSLTACPVVDMAGNLFEEEERPSQKGDGARRSLRL
jgi:hypothetical protein